MPLAGLVYLYGDVDWATTKYCFFLVCNDITKNVKKKFHCETGNKHFFLALGVTTLTFNSNPKSRVTQFWQSIT